MTEHSPTEPFKAETVSGYTVQLLAECVRVELPRGGSKIIGYQEFINSLNTLLSQEDTGGIEYFLSGNEYYIRKSANSLRVMLYYPETVANLEYIRDGSKPRLIPNVVISIDLARSSEDVYQVDLNRVKFFATHKTREEMPRTFHNAMSTGLLTTVPFTNIYGDGKMCFGNNSALRNIKLPDLRPLHSFYYTLLNSPFNDDLGVNSVREHSASGWFSLLADLAAKRTKGGAAPFPYHLLSSLNAPKV